MSERIAEFGDLDDANRFRRMKGAADYDVVAGINLPWAVMPKIRYASNLGRSDEPAESEPFTYDEDEE
jgi:hypothetical protein